MYFWCFGFRGELGFLNCDDVCMCVVNKQFELLLDLFCCNKPSLVKVCISIPGILDHSIVLADCDLKSTINKKPPRKVYQWSKADC